MHIIIALLILIVLLMLFGPWLLVALAVVIGALVAAVAWIVKTLLIPAAIILAALLGLAVVAYAILGMWVGFDKVRERASLKCSGGVRQTANRPLPRFTKSRSGSGASEGAVDG